MINSREFVERKKREIEEEVLNHKSILEERTRMVISEGYVEYRINGELKFPWFKYTIEQISYKFDSSSMADIETQLLEFINLIANSNGWELDDDKASLQPIKSFEHSGKTELPTPNDFEDRIFADMAMEVHSAFIRLKQLVEKSIEEGYDQFQRNGYIRINSIEKSDFRKFLTELNRMDDELQDEVWNVMEENLNRSGWHMKRMMPYYDIIPIKTQI